MDRIATKELYTKLQDRIIMDIKENEIPCPVCKGMLFVLVEEKGKGYFESCRHCHTGKLYVCKYCGQSNKSSCNCKEAQDERHNKFRAEEARKEFEAYQKAEKISYKDYDGYYIFDNDEHLKTQDDLEEWVHERLMEGASVPEYLWAVEGTPHVSIDLLDVISDKCEDGYEDMYDCLETESPLIKQAQEIINQWEKDQGECLCVFNETYKKAVIIKDLIEEIRKEIGS